MCLRIYQLDPVKFHSAPGLAWQVALKKNEVKLELLTNIDMLLLVEKTLEEECQIISMQKNRHVVIMVNLKYSEKLIFKILRN